MTTSDYSSLLSIGVTLAMVGIILRGFASSARRDLARRKEHRLAERKSGDAYMSGELGKPPGWFERNLGSIANVILLTGVALALVGFVKR